MGVPGAALVRTAVRAPVAVVDVGARRVGRAAGAVATLVGGAPERRVWVHEGRAHVQVKGLSGSGPRHRRYVKALTEALRRLDGVTWAEVNAVTGHAMVAYADGRVDVGALVEAVKDVEDAHDAAEGDAGARTSPVDDDMEWTAAMSALVADCAGIAGAVAGRLLALPPMPSPVRAAVAVADAAPHVRAPLERWLGGPRAEALIGVANAVVTGAGQGVAPLASDAAHRVFQLYEVGARREVWRRREPELSAGPRPGEREAGRRRPRPLPDGPVEKAMKRTELGHLFGGLGVLAGTGDPSAAAELLLATVPKAARHGRDAFASVLGHDLARRGVVALDPAALRRLDRVTAVVIDSAVLCGGERRLLSATGEGLDDADVWRVATALLAGRPDPAGDRRLVKVGGAPSDPDGMTLDLVDGRARRRGRVQVGCSLDPMAEGLLAAAHQAADVVVLTEHASTRELVAWGDDSPVAADGLADSVRDLQREGHGVLLIARGRDRALGAADVAVSVLGEDGSLPEGTTGPVDWSADLVCGPGLVEAWRVLAAVRPARRASERAAELALSASVLGALLIAGGRPRRRGIAGWRELPPVHAAGLLAMLSNALSARRLDHRPPPPPVVRESWHALTAEEAFRRLSRPAAEPARPARPGGAGARLAAAVRQELDDPLTPVLALGAAASAVVGSSVDALLVSGVMTGNALIGGAQRMRAERVLGDLLLGQRVAARRLRDAAAGPGGFGRPRPDDAEKVPAGGLRPGDVVLLRAEDVVPADARLLWAESLEVDEATLTGESVPVRKDAEPAPGADPGDRSCMVYEGTTVVAGEASALVVATAEATEAGRAAALAGAMDASSSMQARLAELTREALPATVLGGAAVTALGVLRGLPLRRALGSGVAVAVAAVPEGLPLVATLSQLAAARRLSGIGVLVRSTRALEALGRVDTLCFDKTGTLTEGRLRLVRAAGPARPLSLTGAPGRRILRVAARASPPPRAHAAPHAAAPAHATDRAVLDYAGELPRDRRWTLEEELPFEATRGFSASLGRDGDRTVIAVKGAPEVLLDRCALVHAPGGSADRDEPLTPARRRAAAATMRRLAAEGLRVLAVAERPVPGADGVRGAIADHVEDLTLLGFIGIADTPRPTAAEAVRRLNGAGVRTTMITGDHPDTAAAVAARLAIPGADRVVTGAELDAMPAHERIGVVQRAAVFARVSPAQKVRIVKDLRRAGRVVAMTGDGVNDAAAIRRADVGIAVAGRGSGAARNAADLVLTAPDTALILEALREGRALWRSVRDAAAILVGGNAGEVAFTILGTALSGKAPLTTRQLLVVNMLTDMLPALAVALTPAAPGQGAADAPGAAPVRGFTGRDMRRALAVRGTATAAAALVSWHAGRLTGLVPGGRRRASTMALAALVGAQLGQTLVARWRSPLVIATCLVSAGALLAVVETPGVSHFFGCTPLGPGAWAVVAAAATAATAGAALVPRVLPSAGGAGTL